MKTLKKLIWLIKNQEKIEKLLEKTPKKGEKNFSLAGVPEFQKDYVASILKEK